MAYESCLKVAGWIARKLGVPPDHHDVCLSKGAIFVLSIIYLIIACSVCLWLYNLTAHLGGTASNAKKS